jgi:TonB family protein
MLDSYINAAQPDDGNGEEAIKVVVLMVMSGLAVPAFAAAPTDDRLYAALDGLKDRNAARVGWAETPSIWDRHFRSQKLRWPSSMRIEYNIAKSGRIINCDVTESSGSSAFDNAACGALAQVRDLPVARHASGKVVRASRTLDYRLFYGPAFICATGLDEEEQ